MSIKQPSGPSPRIGVPSEARLNDQRQIASEDASRRYSTMVPLQNIKAEGQFLQKVSQRHWPVGIMLGIWVLVGLPCLAMLVAAVLSVASYPTLPERIWGVLAACLFPTIPLLALLAMTRNWLRQRKP